MINYITLNLFKCFNRKSENYFYEKLFRLFKIATESSVKAAIENEIIQSLMKNFKEKREKRSFPQKEFMNCN